MNHIVVASQCTVRFRGAGGDVFEVPLSDARADELVGSVPWREFRWHKGQRHYSGLWWSSTMRAHVGYESRLELARLILADFDHSVRAIVSQPFMVEADRDGCRRRHVPDFLLALDDGRVRVVNVKPAARLDRPDVVAALAWAHGLFEARGWSSEVWSGADPTLLANVRFLAGFRRTELFDPALLDEIEARAVAGMAIGELERAGHGRWPVALGRPALCHLLWAGRVRADLSVPLSAASRVAAA